MSTRFLFGTLGLLLLMTLAFASCSAFTDSAESTAPPSVIDSVESFAVYFANPWRDTLTTLDLAVLDPSNRSTAEIQQLREQGVLPIAYVSVGEAESYRYFFDQVDPDWLLGKNPNWPDHYYVDARAEGWRALLTGTILPNIRDQGFRGFFLDMVDTALPSLYPQTKPGMIALIEEIRQSYPEQTLIMNNGLFLVEDVQASIDALIVESVFTRYDFAEDRYLKTPPAQRDPVVERLHQYRTEYGLPPLLINYAGSSDSALRVYAARRSRAEGFLNFASTIQLDTLFSPLPAQ